MNLGSLLHGSSQPASSTGRTIGTPRRYDLVTAVLFGGRRRRAFRSLATAAGARKWNDANVVVMGLRLTSPEVAREMLDAWFDTDADPAEADNIGRLEA